MIKSCVAMAAFLCAVTPTAGYGLRRIREIIRGEGGEFEISPGPTGGARLSAIFPRSGREHSAAGTG